MRIFSRVKASPSIPRVFSFFFSGSILMRFASTCVSLVVLAAAGFRHSLFSFTPCNTDSSSTSPPLFQLRPSFRKSPVTIPGRRLIVRVTPLLRFVRPSPSSHFPPCFSGSSQHTCRKFLHLWKTPWIRTPPPLKRRA